MREPTRSKDLNHLLLTDDQLLLGQEPSQTLAAGRRSQAALVGPELLDAADLLDREAHVDIKALELRGVVEVNHWAELLDEGGLLVADSEADADDGGFVFLLGDVHHVDLGAAAPPVNEMF